MDQITSIERSFRSIVVAGSPYETGRQYASAIAEDAELVARYTSGDPETVGRGFGGPVGVKTYPTIFPYR